MSQVATALAVHRRWPRCWSVRRSVSPLVQRYPTQLLTSDTVERRTERLLIFEERWLRLLRVDLPRNARAFDAKSGNHHATPKAINTSAGSQSSIGSVESVAAATRPQM